jgi:hypothetical protein
MESRFALEEILLLAIILPASRAAIVGLILSLISWIRSHTAYLTGLAVTAVTASTSPHRRKSA